MEAPIPSLRWELSFSILDCKENNKQILFDSTPLPITNTKESPFDWHDVNVCLPEMSIMFRDMLSFHMYLHPIKENGERGRIIWFTFVMQYTSLIFHMANKTEIVFLMSHYEDDDTILNLLISGKVYINNYNMRCAKFKLCHATLTTNMLYLQHLINLEQKFRITCLAELSWRDEKTNKMQKAPPLYLARPQHMQCINGKDRIYKWIMNQIGDCSSFQNLKQRGYRDWHKQVEDHADLVRLRVEPPITGKPRITTDSTAIMPDNEAIQNNCTVWPITIRPGQLFTLKMFNMALDDCAKCGIEVVIKWNDYEHITPSVSSDVLLSKSGYKRFSLDFLYKQTQREIKSKFSKLSIDAGTGLIVTLDYESAENVVIVYGVSLHVKNYHYTLQFMHFQTLKSV